LNKKEGVGPQLCRRREKAKGKRGKRQNRPERGEEPQREPAIATKKKTRGEKGGGRRGGAWLDRSRSPWGEGWEGGVLYYLG